MNAGVRMPSGPVGRSARDVLSFRCPPDLFRWVEQLARDGVKRTDAAIWAISLARDYTDALAEFEARIKQLATTSDMTELGIIKRALERGLPSLEKDLKSRK